MPPRVVSGPRDTTVKVGASAVLRCEVSGDPQPDVLWRRAPAAGPNANANANADANASLAMPLGRVSILADRSLRITGARLSDAGLYVCDADNRAGAVSASATLSVVCECTHVTCETGTQSTFQSGH